VVGGGPRGAVGGGGGGGVTLVSLTPALVCPCHEARTLRAAAAAESLRGRQTRLWVRRRSVAEVLSWARGSHRPDCRRVLTAVHGSRAQGGAFGGGSPTDRAFLTSSFDWLFTYV